MNRFRRAAAFIIIAELLIIGVMNWIYLSWEKRQGRFYRVEAERIDMFLEESDALRAAPEDIDLSQFDSIIRVSEYDPSETVNNDYLVEEAGGKLFRIEYKVENEETVDIFSDISATRIIALANEAGVEVVSISDNNESLEGYFMNLVAKKDGIV